MRVVSYGRRLHACILIPAVMLGVVSCTSEQENTDASVASPQESSAVAAPASGDVYQDGEGIEEWLPEYPSQEDMRNRNFSRPYFDDSAYRVPGEWGSYFDQPVYTPLDPNGEPLGEPLSSERPLCDEPVVAPGKITPQYIHGRFFFFTPEHGPGRVQDNGVLVDYAPTPAGAAVALYNFTAATSTGKDLLYKNFAEELVEVQMDGVDKDYGTLSNKILPPTPFPSAFKADKCGGNVIHLSLATKAPTDEHLNAVDDEWLIQTVPMKFEDGKWVVMLSEMNAKKYGGFRSQSIDGFVELRYG